MNAEASLSSDWSSLRSPQFVQADVEHTVVILPIGSTEQHGPHLPVQTDTLLAREVAKRTAVLRGPDSPTLVLPALWVSLAEHHMEMAGTLTLDFETMLAFLRCVVRSLQRQGYRRVLLLNGHGGNMAALVPIVDQLTIEFNMQLASVTYWMAAAESFGEILEGQTNLLHACEAETSMLMHLRSDLVDEPAARSVKAPATGLLQPAGTHRWRPIQHWSCSGVVGMPALASASKGERLLQAASTAVAGQISSESFWCV